MIRRLETAAKDHGQGRRISLLMNQAEALMLESGTVVN
jgi:hypothetical protein